MSGEAGNMKLEETGHDGAVGTWADLIPQVLTLATTFLSAEGNTSALTREAVNLASKLLSLDFGSFSLASGWADLITAGGSWILYYLTLPVLLTGVLWYFVITFILRKNILGRSFRSSAEAMSQQEDLDDLTLRVMEIVDHPR
ncbi:uncharacterized protein [Panulirus ornatus]|uniref:uncharacterized protein n=1 Tax=Panulirus ornatus TaxID=150431 RepID=UPI003A8A9F53